MSTVLPLIKYEDSILVLERFIRKEKTVEIQTKCGRIIEIGSKTLDNADLQDMLQHFQSNIEGAIKYIERYGTEAPYNLDNLLALYSLHLKGSVNYTELKSDVIIVCDNAMVYVNDFDFTSLNGIGVFTTSGLVGVIEIPTEKLDKHIEEVKTKITEREVDKMLVINFKGYKYTELN